MAFPGCRGKEEPQPCFVIGRSLAQHICTFIQRGPLIRLARVTDGVWPSVTANARDVLESSDSKSMGC